MSRYLLYFHYWLEDEPIEAAIDFDPNQQASNIIEEVASEMAFHTGEEPLPNSYIIIEPFNLRPFHPEAWEMNIDQFISKYGNVFAIVNLNQPDIGHLEYFQPNQIRSPLRSKYLTISTSDKDNWGQRAKFELKLISALLRWLTYYKKTKWLRMVPHEPQKYNDRLWKVETDIPDTGYTAEWRILIPEEYPDIPPLVFLKKQDYFIVPKVDFTHIFEDKDGTIFYFIDEITEKTSDWDPELFLADFILVGFWNYLARSVKISFSQILFYKNTLGNPNLLKDIPTELNTDEYHKWAVFFTWYLMRVPEQAIKDLNEFNELYEAHPIISQINWRLLLNTLTSDQLEPFIKSILIYLQAEGKTTGFSLHEIKSFLKLKSYFKKIDNGSEMIHWLEEDPKTQKIIKETIK